MLHLDQEIKRDKFSHSSFRIAILSFNFMYNSANFLIVRGGEEMKKIGVVIGLLVMIVMSGCVKQPEIPKYHFNKSDRIGYVIEPSGNVYHSHMGTTIFNNYDQELSYSWTLEKDIQKALGKNVKRSMINLRKHGISSNDIKDMIVAENGKWVVKKEASYKKLFNELHLKAVLLVSQEDTYVSTGRDPIVMKSSGIASHSLLGLDRYFAVSAYQYNLYLLKPDAVVRVDNVQRSEIIYDTLLTEFQEKSGFKKPVDDEKMTQKELNSVKKKVIQYIDEGAAATNQHIK